jgi:ribonuclease G
MNAQSRTRAKVSPHAVASRALRAQGARQVKTARSVCYDILREICARLAVQPKEFRVVAMVRPSVEMLLDEESVHLAGLSDSSASRSLLSAEPTMNPVQQYDIVPDL